MVVEQRASINGGTAVEPYVAGVFLTGIGVKSVGDFGMQGDYQPDPELLTRAWLRIMAGYQTIGKTPDVSHA